MYNQRSYRSPAPVPPRRGGHRFFKLVALVGLILLGYHLFNMISLPFNLHRQSSATKVAAAARPVLSSAQSQAMAKAINGVIAANPGMDIGVSIQDLNNGQSYTYGVTNPFVAASTSKILTATMFLHQVETGQENLTQNLSFGTAQYELQQMIELSDNTAWQDLNVLLSHDGLQAYAAGLGLSNYDPDTNTLTVSDISRLLGKLYKGELLNKAHTQQLLSYMSQANDNTYITPCIPAGVKVYHKAGWLDDRVHDAAIIDNAKHPYVLVIFTKDNSGIYDSPQGQTIFKGITTATVTAFL